MQRKKKYYWDYLDLMCHCYYLEVRSSINWAGNKTHCSRRAAGTMDFVSRGVKVPTEHLKVLKKFLLFSVIVDKNNDNAVT